MKNQIQTNTGEPKIIENKSSPLFINCSEELLKVIQESRAAFDLLDQGIIIYSPDSYIQYVNLYTKLNSGLTDDDFVGKKFSEMFNSSDIGLVKKQFEGALNGETPYHLTYPISIKDGGDDHYLKKILKPLYGLKNQVIGILGTLEDVTETKLIEMKEKENAFLFKESQEKAGIGSYKANLNLGFWESSETMDKIFGIDSTYDKTIKSWLDLIHPEDVEMIQNYLQEDVILGINNFDKKYRIIRKNDGEIRWVHGLGNMSIDGTYLLGTIQDITEQHENANLLRESNEQLELRQRMDSLGVLAGGIGHDFNNLLTGIVGNISLSLIDGSPSAESKDFINSALVGCKHAAELTKQLQRLSQNTVFMKKDFDIYSVAVDVLSLLQKTTNKIIIKRIDFKEGEFFVNGNESEIHQVLLNLGTNSILSIEEKGTEKGDYIKISAENYTNTKADKTGLPEGEYVHLLFQDNGVGMSEEVIKKAFIPLFTTREQKSVKGSGLGLAMVYNIITNKHSGYIYIESEEGIGTTIHIYLPKGQNIQKKNLKEASEKKGGNETILVIEDDKMIQKMVKAILESSGYNVIIANNGQEGLDMYMAEKDIYDLVLLDLTMPEMTGETVLENIISINNDVKVIISSGLRGEERKPTLSKAKAFVNKPYPLKILTETVRKVLDEE